MGYIVGLIVQTTIIVEIYVTLFISFSLISYNVIILKSLYEPSQYELLYISIDIYEL